MKFTRYWLAGCLSLSSAAAWGVVGFEALPKKAPAPADNVTTTAKVDLGKMLFFDKRLSHDDSVSCNSCHGVNGRSAGVDHLATSKGIKNQFGGRNAPTVLNAAFLSVQFWDGREASLEDQAKGPLINPIEMGNADHDAVVKKVQAIAGYKPFFAKAFGSDAVDIDRIAKAIASYERTLITPNTRYDRYIRGEKNAMTEQEVAGMKLFQTTGCQSCHGGANFSGPSLPTGHGFFQKFPTFANSTYVKKYDLAGDPGRYEATKNPSHKNLWRVPTLRNISQTEPYFHNGKVESLDEAVRVMASTQLNKNLSDAEVGKLVAFLKTLENTEVKETPPVLPR